MAEQEDGEVPQKKNFLADARSKLKGKGDVQTFSLGEALLLLAAALERLS
jgi:hypothetical protein